MKKGEDPLDTTELNRMEGDREVAVFLFDMWVTLSCSHLLGKLSHLLNFALVMYRQESVCV